MVEINPYSSLSNLTQGSSANDRVAIADNFDTFLTLLTTQLQNQNPLDPLDMNQFTQQLVQFTEVEQSIKLNENLEQMVQLTAANTITNAVGYIGKEVTTSGSSSELKNGQASWPITLASDSPAVTYTVKDDKGVQVYTQTTPASAGTSVFNWNGQTDTGFAAPEGTYTLSLVAQDGNGATVLATTQASGIIDGLDMSGDEPVLLSGGRQISLQDIISIKIPSQTDS